MNKTIFITGGAIRIGKAICEKFHEEGFNIICHYNSSIPIMGVGGIFDAEDVIEKFECGASLVQLYTGFVYEGPSIVKKINKKLTISKTNC